MTSLADQIKVGNPTQPDCATVLLLDVSGSMLVRNSVRSRRRF
jgi:hypothetical protein